MRLVKRVGVFGGTFDPVHVGHMIIAELAASQMGWEEVIFVPCNVPPHKRAAAGSADRLEMLRRATRTNPRFTVSAIEIDRGGVSYSIDTLRQMRRELGPGVELGFLVGADSLREMSCWKDPEGIVREATLAVAARPGFGLSEVSEVLRGKVHLLDSPSIEISSSDIRHRIGAGSAFRYMVPEEAYRYILKKRLYGFRGPAPGN